jgi:hypothetical protein
VDLKDAHNLVTRKLLWPAISNAGIPQEMLVVIQKMHAKNEAQVKTGKRISTGFRITKGMKWGCGLSPDLFKIFLEIVLYNWNKRCKIVLYNWNRRCKSMGLPTGNKTTQHLVFLWTTRLL